MPTFDYEALQPDGRTTQGTLEAESASAARQQLRLQGLAPMRVHIGNKPIEPNQTAHAALSLPWGTQGPSQHEVTLLVQQLASLLQAGLALAVALQALVEQCDKPAVRQLLQAIRADVQAGNRFSQALTRYPATFPELIIATIAAGEQTGQLGTVMAKLADTLQARQALHHKVVAAFVYPAIVTVVALLVVVGLLTYVVPQVVAVFENTQQALPTLTVVMMTLSSTLRQWGWAIALAVLLGLWAVRQLLKIPHWRLRWDTALLRWPLVGPWVRAVNTARLASTLAILIGSGVPLSLIHI
jgi:general secretion pathway protein F